VMKGDQIESRESSSTGDSDLTSAFLKLHLAAKSVRIINLKSNDLPYEDNPEISLVTIENVAENEIARAYFCSALLSTNTLFQGKNLSLNNIWI